MSRSRAKAAPRPASRATPAARPTNDLVYGGSTAAPTPSASATLAPETAAYRDYGNRVYQAKWTAPASNKLLLEAGFGSYRSRWGGKEVPGLGATESDSRRRAVRDRLRGQRQHSRADVSLGELVVEHQLERRSGTPARRSCTGSHSMKVGYQGALLFDDRKNFTNSRVPAVPLQQRRSGSDDAVDQRVPDPPARAQRCVLRAGAVDAAAA